MALLRLGSIRVQAGKDEFDQIARGQVVLNEHSQIAYEAALRVIGRHLDMEPPYYITLQEGADGFTVESIPGQQRAEGRSVRYTWERLGDLAILQKAGRGLRKRQPRHSAVWDNFPNGHEDFFRALGHILDVEFASNLSLSEEPNGISVGYTRPSPDDPTVTERYETVMQRAEIERILRDAQSRRNLRAVS